MKYDDAKTNSYFEKNNLNRYSRKEVFGVIYEKNLWAIDETKSGVASQKDWAKSTLVNIQGILNKFGIRSILDAPCGDCNWQADLFDLVESYIGVDIVDQNISKNSRRFGYKSKVVFRHCDLVDETPEAADIIICRDLMIHLSNASAAKVLDNFRKSGSKYLLATNYLKLQKNEDIGDGSYRPINLSLAPFNLPAPIFSFEERYWFEDDFGRAMSLWEIKSI